MRKISTILILLLIALGVNAQSFEVTRIETAGGKVILYYDLLDTASSRQYAINIYSSRDNYIQPLEFVLGDVGIAIKPGINKTITWDVGKEFGMGFRESVSLEIRGSIYIPFIMMDQFYEKIKRGKVYPITWTGGTSQNVLNFELFKGDKKVDAFTNIANEGEYNLLIPTTVAPGKDYYFKVSDVRNRDDVIYTTKFTIQRKLPLAAKIIPVAAVVGVGVYFVLQGTDPENNDIPDPVTPEN